MCTRDTLPLQLVQETTLSAPTLDSETMPLPLITTKAHSHVSSFKCDKYNHATQSRYRITAINNRSDLSNDVAVPSRPPKYLILITISLFCASYIQHMYM